MVTLYGNATQNDYPAVQQTSTANGYYGGVPYGSPMNQQLALQAQARADLAGSMGLTYDQNVLQAAANAAIGVTQPMLGSTVGMNPMQGWGGAGYVSPRLTTVPLQGGVSSWGGGGTPAGQEFRDVSSPRYPLPPFQLPPFQLPPFQLGWSRNTYDGPRRSSVPEGPPPYTLSGEIDLGRLMLPNGVNMQPASTALLAILGQRKAAEDNVNYKPYNDILQRFPDATAQADGPTRINRDERHSVTDWVDDPRVTGFGPTGQPMREQTPQAAPTTTVTSTGPGDAMPPPQMQSAPLTYSTGPGDFPPIPQFDPPPMSPTGYAPTDLIYRALPQNQPGYQFAAAQQQAMMNQLQAIANKQITPPQPIQFTGAQRFAMAVDRNTAAQYSAYARAMMEADQRRYANELQQQQQARAQLAQMANSRLSQEGQNARSLYGTVATIAQKLMEEPKKENFDSTAKWLIENFPVGPQRNAAIAAFSQNGIDFGRIANVEQPQKQVSMEQGRQARIDAANQKAQYNTEMNPLKLEAQRLRNTRLAQTNPAYIRMTEARADLAEQKNIEQLAYGDQKQKLDIQLKQQRLEGQINKDAKDALSKTNALINQYDTAVSNIIKAAPDQRADLQKQLIGRFGNPDPETGLPEDIADAYRVSRELNQQMRGAAQPSAAPSPMGKAMAKTNGTAAAAPMTKEQYANDLAAQVKANKITREQAIAKIREFR